MRLEKLKARREFRKMMKKSDIKKTLEQIEDYAAFYDDNSDSERGLDHEEEDDDKLGVFANEQERQFYANGEDMDFVRYHKRTTRNFRETLQQLIDSNKQTVARGIKNRFSISLNHVKLNKSCTVAHIFWSTNLISPELVSDQARRFEAYLEKEFIEKERSARMTELQILQERKGRERDDNQYLDADDEKERHLQSTMDSKIQERAMATNQDILVDRERQ